MERSQRIKKLNEFVNTGGDDSFALYALAMELAAAGDLEKSDEWFQRLLKVDPSYTIGYQQYAKVLIEMKRFTQAKIILDTGIPQARQNGHLHARDKMQEMLDQLPDVPT